jgi:8-oxo-dGTP pyrophosphatase MutT (NUDIX family)
VVDGEWRGPVRDQAHPAQLISREERFAGHVWSVARDDVRLPGGAIVSRDLVVHPGAVGVAALDERDRLLLIRQYRYPVGGFLLELPAGLRDVPGEPPLVTAQRELAEEAGIQASDWHVLVDFFNSPGGSTEEFRCYLARGITRLPEGRTRTGEAEEADLPQVWVDLDAAVDAVLAGDVRNPTTVMGVLAAAAARDRGWRSLRSPDQPMWQEMGEISEEIVQATLEFHPGARVVPRGTMAFVS